LRRFSAAVPYAIAVLFAAGVVLAVVQVEQPSALLDTAYGRVLLIKLALLAVLFVLAAFNRWRLTRPAASGDARGARRLARTIAAEVAMVLLILAVVACWRFTPPPRALAIAAAQPATTHIHAAKAMADVTVTPGRAGPVAVSIFVMTGDFDPLPAMP
jgi:copper transport protein